MSVNKLENAWSFLQNGGEMGALTRQFDWSKTSLGSPDQWPQSLRTTLSIVLNSKFPMFLFWGEELICFYNDAYRPSLGNNGKHPKALGMPGKAMWGETWEVIKPLIDQVLAGGEASWNENQLLPIYRNNQLENVYWTYSYSAVKDEMGKPAGVFVTCMETTASVHNLQALNDSKEQLEFSIEANELGTYDYNPLTNKFTANDRLKDWFGLPPAAEIDLSVAINAIAEEDKERVTALIKNALLFENGGRYDTQYTIVHPITKVTRIVKAKGKAWFNEDQVAYRLNGTLQDVTEEAGYNKRLVESEAYFRQLTDTVPAILWITQADGYCTYLSKNWYEFTGQTKQEAEGFGWLTAIHPDDLQSVEKAFVEANEKHITFTSIYRLLEKKGSYRWVHDIGSPKYGLAGEFEGMIGTVVDIHEQKLAEEKIRNSEAKFRSLIAAAPVAIGLFVGRDLIIESPNQAFLDIVGRNESIIGKPLRNAMPELVTEGQPFLQILDNVYTSGQMFKTYGTQVKIVRDGAMSYNYYDFSYTPLLDENGNTYAILDISIDVTEEVLNRLKVEKAEERTRLAVAASELGMYEINLLTHEVVASPRFNEIFDVFDSRDHTDYIKAIHPEDVLQRELAHKDAFETGTIFYESRIIKKSGAVHWIRVKGKVDFDTDNQPLKLLGVVQDITDQKEMERQKDNFLGIASHELKTPVTSIKGYTQFLERKFRKNGDNSSAELLGKMNVQVNRLSTLIGDLLDVTKMNNGRIQFNAKPFDFNQMVEEVIDEMQRTSEKHHIGRQLNFKGLVNSDRERIYQVVVNLISNAIKYSPEANRIIVFTEDHGTEVQLCVQDFGIGISQDKKDQVFEQFYRVSGTKEHTFPGLGLGLYISSEIVKRMNGRIWVNSVEGKGSTFCFSIPV